MQYKPKEYNPEEHDRFKALSVKQPYAGDIRDGKKKIELRNSNTKYRGDLLICSTVDKKYKSPGETLVFVELYDVKKVKDLTPDEIEQTCTSEKIFNRFKNGYAWMLRNPRPTIEFPVKGQLGIWNLIYTKDVIMTYPIYYTPEEQEKRRKWRIWVWLGLLIFCVAFWTFIFKLLF